MIGLYEAYCYDGGNKRKHHHETSDDLLSSGQCEDPPGRDGKSGRYRRYISAIFLAGANFWAILGHFGNFG